MSHYVKCYYCGKTFDRDKVPFIKVKSNRYAHKDCALSENEKQDQEEKDKEALENYIMKLFNTTYIDPKVRKQIKQYTEEYHYSYSGILKSLTYFYEVKNNSIAKANGGIGIVPYVYQIAYRYYYALWEAQQRNQDKNIVDYVPGVKEIIIPPPERKMKKRKLFSFLDKEN